MFSQDEKAALVQDCTSEHPRKANAIEYYDITMRSIEAQGRLREWAEQYQGDPALEEARRDLLPALLTTERLYNWMPRQWPEVFRRLMRSGDDESEVRSAERFRPGLPRLRPRGTAITRSNPPDSPYGVWVYDLEPHEVALGTSIKGGAIAEGQHIEQFGPLALGMAESFLQAEEVIHANMLNTGRVYNAVIGGDGVSLFSAEHRIKDGGYSNIFEPVSLTEIALEGIAICIRKLPDRNGMLLLARPKKLIVPVHLQFTADRLFQEPAIRATYPDGYCVLDFLTHPAAWFVQTYIPGLISVEWKPFRLDLKVEGDALILEGTQTYGCGYNNPRAIVGCFPDK